MTVFNVLVQKVPLFTEDNQIQSSRFAVMFDPDGLNREVGVVSEVYQLLTVTIH